GVGVNRGKKCATPQQNWLSSMRINLRVLTVLCFAWAIVAYDDDDTPNNAALDSSDSGADGSDGDEGDGSLIPPGAHLCSGDDAEYDDDVDYTRDTCDPLGYCRHDLQHSACADEVFCNGVELCDPRTDCVPGP